MPWAKSPSLRRITIVGGRAHQDNAQAAADQPRGAGRRHAAIHHHRHAVGFVGLALLGVVAERPDLIVSGINQGANLGHDVTYSGTFAATMEGVVYGIPAIAASQDESDGQNGA